jgi:Zn-dependent protease
MTAERDPRAHWLDDDPFDKRSSPGSHSAARDDGNWRQPHIRVVHATGSGAPFVRIFGVEEQARPIPIHTGSIWHFSKTEIEHLTQAIFAFTIALAFMSVDGIFGALEFPAAFIIGGIFWIIPIAPAFIVHEVAHKIVARNYGCWAEFRASPRGLRFGIILAAIFGFFFMAPGAVMVAGNTTRSQFGKIALAGPVSNILLWAVGLGMVALGLETTNFTYGGHGLLSLWCWINVGFGAFNMLPIGPLDGKKIKTWSDSIYWFWALIFVGLIWFNLNVLPGLF